MLKGAGIAPRTVTLRVIVAAPLPLPARWRLVQELVHPTEAEESLHRRIGVVRALRKRGRLLLPISAFRTPRLLEPILFAPASLPPFFCLLERPPSLPGRSVATVHLLLRLLTRPVGRPCPLPRPS